MRGARGGVGGEVWVTLGWTRSEGVGASITGCKLGRPLGDIPSLCKSRDSPFRRPASSADRRIDGGNTPPIVGCGERFDLELGVSVKKDVFFSLRPFISTGLAGDSMSLCFGVQIRPALQRNHVNEPPIMRIKRAVAVNTPVTSASEFGKIFAAVIKYQ